MMGTTNTQGTLGKLEKTEMTKINGEQFTITRVHTNNRTASARLKGYEIIIRIPSRWPHTEQERIAAGLLKRAELAIAKGRWKPKKQMPLRFSHGQLIQILGKKFEITVLGQQGETQGTMKTKKRQTFSARTTTDGRIEVKVKLGQAAQQDQAATDARITELVQREIIRGVMPLLSDRVNEFNAQYFQATISKLKIRNNATRWGSCSTKGTICLDFKLLFMPEHILDYVIVHELAHTKHRSHGKRFWALVESIIPDHKEKRKWLRQNGASAVHEVLEGAAGEKGSAICIKEAKITENESIIIDSGSVEERH